MGRPLNKDFFGDGVGLLQATLAFLPGAGSAVLCHILRQRSNTKYEVANEATVASTALVVGAKYLIVTVSGADYTTVGAPNNSVGTRFTATGTSAGGTGTAREFAVCKLQEATPAADFEMHIEVQGENAEAVRQATANITSAGGTGALETVEIADGGYGYWADATAAALGGTTDGTVDYTVDGNGSIATVTINAAGAANTQANGINLGAAPDANPPLAYARIINAHHVKTYASTGINATTFAWPLSAPVDQGRAGFSEATIDTQ